MADQSPTHTWTSLLALVQPPSPAQYARYVVAVPSTDLVERGAKIRSEKILTDTVRIGGMAAEFWTHASPAQKRHLLGFSWPLLQVFVHSGKKLADMLDARESNADEREANRAAAISIADQQYHQGMDERDRLVVALEAIEGLIPGLDARVAAARATVIDHDSLATSLFALVNLSKELLDLPQSRVAEQLVDGGLTADELTAVEAVAHAVKSASEHAAGARKQGTVLQGDLDLQDGTCLEYLERVMRIFNRAHERDASIPRLLPIATRRMFSFGRKAPKAAAPAPEKPT